ncbi:MAG: hypothetical protein KDC46_00190 [Thermoleophilia bacterium]|nr:hypothetical protein [Thermoleophilia bacterium]
MQHATSSPFTRLLAAVAFAALLLVLLPAGAQARTRSATIPKNATPGTTLRITASGLRARTATVLYVGPRRSEGELVARGRTNAAGRVTFRVRLHTAAAPGAYVSVVCQRSCRTKSSSAFTIRRQITFTPGIGVLGANVASSRARSIAVFGTPNVGAAATSNYMSWRAAGSQVDAYLTRGVARSWSVMGRRSCTTFGFCVGDQASELQARYGSALRQHAAVDENAWVVVGTWNGIRTYTAFVVRDFDATTTVSQAWIGRCADATYC